MGERDMGEPLFARDVMTTPVTVVSKELPVAGLIALIQTTHFSGIPVMDDAGHIVGLISQSDVLQALAYLLGGGRIPQGFHENKRRATSWLLGIAEAEGVASAVDDLLGKSVADFMSTELVFCQPDMPLDRVCDTMVKHHKHRIVVLHEDRTVAGIITATDLVQFLGITLRRQMADDAEAEVVTLPETQASPDEEVDED